jgi:hypothetical protein
MVVPKTNFWETAMQLIMTARMEDFYILDHTSDLPTLNFG